MNIKENDSIYKKQKNIRPKIEDVIYDVLDEEAIKNVLDFVQFLKSIKLNPQWSAANSWKVHYLKNSVCYIRLHGSADYNNLAPGMWHIQPCIGDYEETLPNEMKEIIWSNIKKCPICGNCRLKLNSIFGKKIENSCEGSVVFNNPNVKTIECAKKLIEMRKDAIQNGNVKKHIYIPIKNRK